MTDEPRLCRCCGIPITVGMLACRNHWFMLPRQLREAILTAYRGNDRRVYVHNVKLADSEWQRAGVWIPRPLEKRASAEGASRDTGTQAQLAGAPTDSGRDK